MITWIRIVFTVPLAILAFLLQFGLRNSWIYLVTQPSGPVSLASITYDLAEPYRTIALIVVVALIILVWLPSLLGKSSQGKKVKRQLLT